MIKKTKKSGGKKKTNSKYLFILFFLAILILAILVVRPFLSTIIVSAIIVYVLYPVYKYFCRITGMKRFSAAIIILLVLLLISIPLIMVTGTLTKESYDIYTKAKQVFLDNSSFEAACLGSTGFICGLYSVFSSLYERYNLGFHLAQGFINS